MSGTDRRIAIAQPSLGDEEWLALRDTLQSGWLTQGPKVAAFEAAFAESHQVTHAKATTSCTTALHVALLALGIGPGDEVIVPAFTWIATANAVLFCGATPVLADVDPVTLNVDPDSLAAAITTKTRAVLPVHLFGLCADIDAIRDRTPDGVAIVEDAACAAGAEYRGRRAGSLGDAGCFSFHPRKSITTGEGGMVTTNESSVAAAVDRLRNHGASVPEEVRHAGPRPHQLPEFEVLGYNYRMTDLQASIGLVQLSKLDGFVNERSRWAAWYSEELAQLGWLSTPSSPPDGRHAWQAFVCMVSDDAPIGRNELMDELARRGVSTRPGTHAVHLQGYYTDRYGFAPHDFPQAYRCHTQTLALPLHNQMTDEDYAYVVDSLVELGS
jgi:dTDP-4-amino-4,6-dideoxygalactose transaminase